MAAVGNKDDINHVPIGLIRAALQLLFTCKNH